MLPKLPTPHRRLSGPGVDKCQHFDETLYLRLLGRRDAVSYSETFVCVIYIHSEIHNVVALIVY